MSSKPKRGRVLACILIAGGACAVAPALAAAPDGAAGPWADFVVESSQGTRTDNTPVIPARSDPSNALGVAENTTADSAFFSLGFGGKIVLAYENKICNGAGDQDLDLQLVEGTIEPYPEEKVDVYVSSDNVTYTLVASGVDKDSTIGLPSSITVAQHYVKLVDASERADYQPPNQSRPTADAYDVDGVRALNTEGCAERVGVGRMTGGGSLFLPSGTRVTHGFTLRCENPTANANDIQVNWDKGKKFHLESVSFLDCLDDPSISEGQPVAGFDTIVGRGLGRYNGVSGHKVDFKLTDAGEPGTSDFGHIVVTAPDNTVVLDVSGLITKGNQQAHHSG